MLTPQDIKDKKFEKALVGGYEMSVVDDFLERLHEDYAALYKESAILKSKLKVLVEKVEEYRSTEDSMRMALVTAQKMGAEITEEAKKKGDAILAEVNQQAAQRAAALRSQLALEEARLEEAKRETGAFSKKVLTLLDGERTFIEGLNELVLAAPAASVQPTVPAVQAMPEPPPSEEAVPVIESTPIVPVAPPPPPAPPEELPFGLPPQAPVTEAELSLDHMESDLGAYLAQEVGGMMAEPVQETVPQAPAEPPAQEFVFMEAKLEGKPQAPFFDDATTPAPPATYTQTEGTDEVEFYKLFDEDPGVASAEKAKTPELSIFEEVLTQPATPTPQAPAEAPPAPPVDARAAEKIDIARSISASLGDTEELKVDVDAFWDDEGPPTTTRPKFDFENLQFGSNYDDA